MTAGDLQRAAESFTFSGGLAMWKPALLVLRDRADDRVVLKLVISVPDRETGDPTTIQFTEMFQDFMLPAIRDAKSFLTRLVERWLMHEVLEGIVVDGVRVRDPHRHEGLTAAR